MRVDAADVRVRVIGEGGNPGIALRQSEEGKRIGADSVKIA